MSQSKRVDVLAVGHAPTLRINRLIYRALRDAGWALELAVPRDLPGSPAVEPPHADDPPIHYLDAKGTYTRTWSFTGLRELLDERRPRIVYLENEPDSTMAWTLGRWCVRNGASLIVNTNENDIPKILPALMSRGLKPALRALRTHLWCAFTRPGIRHVVAICRDGVDAMHSVGFKAVTLTPLGFDERRFHPEPELRDRMRAKLGIDGVAIAYFGRLAPNKGVHILIEALGRIRQLTWKLLIDDFQQSSGAYAEQLRDAIARNGLADRTVFIHATHDEMPDYMRAADIVVVPSTWKEQYGRVVPEAMACGCTVVASNIGALPELVGEAGVLTPAGDVARLAAVLTELMADPTRQTALAAAAVERAHGSYGLRRQTSVLDGVFRNVASTAGVSSE